MVTIKAEKEVYEGLSGNDFIELFNFLESIVKNQNKISGACGCVCHWKDRVFYYSPKTGFLKYEEPPFDSPAIEGESEREFEPDIRWNE